MTDDRELSLILDRWLDDGPTEMPDRVIDVMAVRISRQRQRPAWRLDWRRYAMNTNVKIAAVLVAVLAIAVAGYNLLPVGSTGVGGPAPTASPTAQPTPSATLAPPSAAPTVPASALTGGLLAPGTYWTSPFPGTAGAVTLTFTVPSGWEGFPDWAVLGPNGPDGPDGLGVGFLMASALYSDPCHWDAAKTGVFPQPGDIAVGPTVDDLVNALQAHQAYDATEPVDITIDGHVGKQIDLQMPSDVDFDACDTPTGAERGAYLIWSPPTGTENDLYVQGPGNRWRLRILDVEGERVIIVVNDFPATPAQDRAAAQAIVDSIRITP